MLAGKARRSLPVHEFGTRSSTIQMTRRHQSFLASTAFLAGLAAASWPYGVSADPIEVCVRCMGPAQSYSCELAGAQPRPDRRAAGFYCAARLAEDNGHRSCAAVRNDSRCAGEHRRYVYTGDTPLPPPLTEVDEDSGAEPGNDSGKQDRANRQGPPETVVDLTRETGESLERAANETAETTRSVGERVREAVSGAAGAVDRAARNTVKCIGSLFDDC